MFKNYSINVGLFDLFKIFLGDLLLGLRRLRDDALILDNLLKRGCFWELLILEKVPN